MDLLNSSKGPKEETVRAYMTGKLHLSTQGNPSHFSGFIQALMESASSLCHDLTPYQAPHSVMQENVPALLGVQRRISFAFKC